MMRCMEQRSRAPARDGHRTTLRVPDALMTVAQRLAGESGTTANDIIVQLAEAGAERAERSRRAQALAMSRREAVARTPGALEPQFPSAEEIRRAALSGRLMS